MGKFCTSCGERLLGNESFCGNCGASTTASTISASSSTAPSPDVTNVGSDGLTPGSRNSLKFLRVFLASFLMACIPLFFLPIMNNFLQGKRNLMDININSDNVVVAIIALVVSIPAFLWASNVEEKKRKRKELMEMEHARREKETLETNRRILELMEKEKSTEKPGC